MDDSKKKVKKSHKKHKLNPKYAKVLTAYISSNNSIKKTAEASGVPYATVNRIIRHPVFVKYLDNYYKNLRRRMTRSFESALFKATGQVDHIVSKGLEKKFYSVNKKGQKRLVSMGTESMPVAYFNALLKATGLDSPHSKKKGSEVTDKALLEQVERDLDDLEDTDG